MPHPLEHVVVLKVMTTKETKPEAMVAKAINDSIAEVSHLRAKFVVSGSKSAYSRRFHIVYRQIPLIPRSNLTSFFFFPLLL